MFGAGEEVKLAKNEEFTERERRRLRARQGEAAGL